MWPNSPPTFETTVATQSRRDPWLAVPRLLGAIAPTCKQHFLRGQLRALPWNKPLVADHAALPLDLVVLVLVVAVVRGLAAQIRTNSDPQALFIEKLVQPGLQDPMAMAAQT